MKQMGTAIMMYTQDYDETLPPGCHLWGNSNPLEKANPTLWAKIQRAKAEAAQGERRS